MLLLSYHIASHHGLWNGEVRWVQMAAFPLIAFGLFRKNHRHCSLKVCIQERHHGCATLCIAGSAEAGRATCSALLLKPIQQCVGFSVKAEGTSTLELCASCRAPPEHLHAPYAKHRIWLIFQDDYMIHRHTPWDNANLCRESWRIGTSVKLPSNLLIELNSCFAVMQKTIIFLLCHS